jgi:hypothetical protein
MISVTVPEVAFDASPGNPPEPPEPPEPELRAPGKPPDPKGDPLPKGDVADVELEEWRWR